MADIPPQNQEKKLFKARFELADISPRIRIFFYLKLGLSWLMYPPLESEFFFYPKLDLSWLMYPPRIRIFFYLKLGLSWPMYPPPKTEIGLNMKATEKKSFQLRSTSAFYNLPLPPSFHVSYFMHEK